MILGVDTYYSREKIAKTVGVLFEWNSDQPLKEVVSFLDNPHPYVSGSLFKRELPCILKLLNENPDLSFDAILVDGYAILEGGKKGLGGHLFDALNKRTPVIGVAKASYKRDIPNCVEVLRGESRNPLYVTTCNYDLTYAAESVAGMSGRYRIPSVLKRLDQLTRNTF